MLWQGAKWRILKNFNVQNEECHHYAYGYSMLKHVNARWLLPFLEDVGMVWLGGHLRWNSRYTILIMDLENWQLVCLEGGVWIHHIFYFIIPYHN